jgi:lysozyme
MPKIQPYKKVAASVALIALLGFGAAELYTNSVAQHEGLVLEAYKDPVGIWTKCYGDTYDVVPGATYSRDECLRSLDKQLIAHAKPVLACLPELASASDGEKAGHLDLAYNIGVGAYCKSTAARLVRKGDRLGACKAIGMYTRAGGKVIPGLVKRRAVNVEMCERGVKGEL